MVDVHLRIGYLMNSYPMTSTTFIRREIESLEALGLQIRRYAVRHWGEKLVDPLDVAEQERTHYLLTGNARALVLSFFVVFLTNPLGLLRGLALWLRVCRNSGALTIRHFAYLLQATYFYRRSRQDGLQHVHVHFSTNATTVAMLARRMGGVSYSFTAHGPDEFVDPTVSSLSLKVENAAFVAAISHYCKVLLVRFSSFAHWDKIVIVHCGLDVGDFRADFAFDEGNRSLVCVGRICPQKAQLLIPPALALLKSDFPDVKVHFVGDGESRPALEAAIERHGTQDMVALHGWMVNSEVRELLAESRALLLPSFAEGLPVVIMESLALGRPVISSYIAGIPELVDGSCGWLVPAGSIEGIASAIRAALTTSPEKLAEMGREGRRRIEAEHNLSTIAPKLCSAFAAAASSGP